MTPQTGHPRFRLIAGIAGGLGPYAHLWLEKRLLELAVQRFKVAGDRDFPEWVVSSVPQTPDRTDALAGRADNPTPFLLRSLQRLRAAGADFAVIACNTIHAFLPRLADAGRVPLPVAHVVCETLDSVRRTHPKVKRVGLLATTGTCRSGLFDAAFARAGIELVRPDEAEQDALVMTAIYGPDRAGQRAGGIKAGLIDAGSPSPRQLLRQAADRLVHDSAARLILVACSEISLALGPTDTPVPLVDTMDVLAGVALDLASGQRGLDSLAQPPHWPRPAASVPSAG